jgi:hypothetical protein
VAFVVAYAMASKDLTNALREFYAPALAILGLFLDPADASL